MACEVRVTETPDPGRLDSSHLIERAARRLQESGDAGAAGLLPGAPAPTPLPIRPLPPPAVPYARVNGSEHTPYPPGDAAMPEIDQAMLERAGMIDWTKHRQRMSEEFRIIQGQLAQAMAATATKGNALPNLIMITSARPGEGKTFTSINLAGSLARYASRPVILVDMDSSRHTLSSRLGQERMAGLLDLAVDPRLPIETVIRRTSMAGLSLMPIGGLDGVRAVLSASTPIIDVVERLAKQYASSTIILDAPPCLSSSDPSTLAHLVGQAVMLVEAQRTQRSEVEAALDLIDACPTISLILTKVKLTVSDTFGAYGYY
jgi:receptor protein-tyrosine kinase